MGVSVPMVLRNRHMMVGRLAVAAACTLLGTPALAAEASCVYTQMSTIDDDRIDESSSLAMSTTYAGVVYTANDERGPVYAVDIASGDVVGTTTLDGADLDDPEALAANGKGKLLLADIGDNDADRDGIALYKFPDLGAGTHSVTATRYPVAYSDGSPHNAETLLISPVTRKKFIVTKNPDGAGALYALPALQADQRNVATNLARSMPRNVSDGTFTPDGRWAILRNASNLFVVDPTTWTVVQKVSSPPLDKGESVTVRPRGKHLLVGSEGESSPLVQVEFDAATGRFLTE